MIICVDIKAGPAKSGAYRFDTLEYAIDAAWATSRHIHQGPQNPVDGTPTYYDVCNAHCT